RIGPPEPNAFGTNEFLDWCDDIGAEPSLTANVGTAAPGEAAEWVRYCNGRVRTWFLGNELYSDLEAGGMDPASYADAFRAFSEAMLAVDPTLRFVAVGMLPDQPSRHELWNEIVAPVLRPGIDLLSVHWYWPFLGRSD